MRMKHFTSALLFAFGLLCVNIAVAQDEEIKKPSLVPLSPYTKSISHERTPLDYHAVQEADIYKSWRIWRMVDLREKLNHPLYYPTQRMRNRHSFVQVLIDSIKHGAIRAYSPVNSEFTDTLSFKDVAKNFGAVETQEKRQSLSGTDTTVNVPAEWRWNEVKQLLVMEEWFIDRRRSILDVRIVGICPIRVFNKVLKTGEGDGNGEEVTTDAEDDSELSKVPLFWIYYPEARKVLGRTMAFNPQNLGPEYTYDDIFLKRMFASYIVKSANTYDDRSISDYTVGGIPNMQESERITNSIMDNEQDLWEY
nr:gliding motility protein GldN [uncultured Acetobacteroides sp.]